MGEEVEEVGDADVVVGVRVHREAATDWPYIFSKNADEQAISDNSALNPVGDRDRDICVCPMAGIPPGRAAELRSSESSIATLLC